MACGHPCGLCDADRQLAGAGPAFALRTGTDQSEIHRLAFSRCAERAYAFGSRAGSALNRHAPVLEIDVAGTFDRIGALALDGEDRVTVDTAAPVAYTRITYTLLGGVIYPQLVYTFWFSERPRRRQQV